MVAIVIGAFMALLQWLCVDLVNGYAVITIGGRMAQFTPPSGVIFYYGVYVFSAVLIMLGFRKLLGGRF